MLTPSHRDEWYDQIAEDICTLGRELVGQLQLPGTVRQELAAAAVLLSVLGEDRRAMPSYLSARRLRAAGVIGGDEREIAQSLVQPARQRWRRYGVPAANWWAPEELLNGLVERLTPEVADSFLTAVFELSQRTIGMLRAMPTALPEPPIAPTDLLAVGGDDPAVHFLVRLAAGPAFKKVLEERRAATVLWSGPMRPPFWDLEERAAAEDWLRSAWMAMRTWQMLAARVERLNAGGDAEREQMIARATAVCKQSVAASQRWLEGLGLPELAMLAHRDESDLRRRRFLHARLRIHNVSLQMPDAVPDQVPEAEPAPVPAWVAEEVYERGARLMHRQAGPHVLCWAVAETSTEAALMRPVPLGVPPPRRGLALKGPDADGRVTINLVPNAEDPKGNDIRLPFSYFPHNLEHAVEIILLSLVGQRMDYYRLANDALLTHLGGEWLMPPVEHLAELTAKADRILADAEAEHPGQDLVSMLADKRLKDDQTPHMVTGVDNAKSEVLLSELTLPDEPDIRMARQRLAEAEVRRVSAEVDGRPHAQQKAADEATQAMDAYRTLRQKLAPTRNARFPEAFDGIVTPRRAFVQLADTGGFLSAGIVVHDGERPVAKSADVSMVTTQALQRATEALQMQSTREHQEHVLLGILDELGELIIEPVLDTIAGYAVTHLVLCPSRSLEPFPLHAARVGKQRLDDLHDVSYTPSAAVLRTGVHRPSVSGDQTLIVASSGAQVPAVVDLQPVPGPAKEAALLQAILPDAVIRVDDLDAATLQAEIARYAVVHLAGHGKGRVSGWDSGLWVGGPSPSAAYLSAAAVLAGPALSAVSLVVLNACDTAVDREGGVAIQAWRGLDAAFLARGARAVVSSLGPIGDRTAAVWSAVFHIERVAGTGLARACKVAADAIRTGIVPAPTRKVLDQMLPGGADELTAAGEHRPLAWALWRPSGICW